MRDAVDRRRVLHIHPSLRCNLKCAHCYSSSGPTRRESQPASVLTQAIRDASQVGYQIASFSGGEPMLYKDLPELLEAAKQAGMHTSVVSNGTCSASKIWRQSLPLIDALVLSIDGPPELHNALRRSTEAFRHLQRSISELQRTAVRFSLIHTVTSASWKHIDWLYDFASERGAQTLQLHPLERSGRALTMASTDAAPMPPLDRDELLQVYLYVQLSADFEASLRLHADISHVDLLDACPEYFYGAFIDDCNALPNPLVIEEAGVISPMSYGIDRALSCGNLATGSLIDVMLDETAGWRQSLQRHCEKTRSSLLRSSDDSPVFSWYEALGELHPLAA